MPRNSDWSRLVFLFVNQMQLPCLPAADGSEVVRNPGIRADTRMMRCNSPEVNLSLQTPVRENRQNAPFPGLASRGRAVPP
jgi:hypothetical protein